MSTTDTSIAAEISTTETINNSAVINVSKNDLRKYETIYRYKKLNLP